VFDDGTKVRTEVSRRSEFHLGYIIKFNERIFILNDGDWEKMVLAAPPPSQSAQDFESNIRRK
jgi:hypothetical protein